MQVRKKKSKFAVLLMEVIFKVLKWDYIFYIVTAGGSKVCVNGLEEIPLLVYRKKEKEPETKKHHFREDKKNGYVM